MIKEHVDSGRLYLCVKYTASETVALNYTGSGLIVKRLKKKYGKSCMRHKEILFSTEDKAKLANKGKYYSDLYDIVKSDKWLNLVPELGGGGCVDNYNKGKIIVSNSNRQKFISPHEIKEYELNGWKRGLLESTKKTLSETLKGREAHNKGKKMKELHEYKTDRHIPKSEEEKFQNRSNARKEVNSRPDVIRKLKEPRKPLMIFENIETGEIVTQGRVIWKEILGDKPIRSIINGTRKNNIIKDWEFIGFE